MPRSRAITKHPHREKTFRVSLGVLCVTAFGWALDMWLEGVTDPFYNPTGVLGKIMIVDKILTFLSVGAIIVTGIWKRWFS